MGVMTEKNKIDNELKNSTKRVDNKRRAFSKAGIILPVALTLTNKTALGSVYQCTISGMQSGNLSNQTEEIDCGVGYSPGGIGENACKAGNQDGNINQWLLARLVPFDIGGSEVNEDQYVRHFVKQSGVFRTQVAFDYSVSPPEGIELSGCEWGDVYSAISGYSGSQVATKFSDIFPCSTDDRTLHQKLISDTGGLDFQAISAYWNAAYHAYTGAFGPVYDGITPAYIASVYCSSDYTDAQKQRFFEMIHH